MIINKQSLEDIKNWTKLIVHPAKREIEDRMEKYMEENFDENSQWAFQNFTEIVIDPKGNIIDQDSSFDPEECWEDEDGVLIPIMLFQHGTIRKLYIDFNVLCD